MFTFIGILAGRVAAAGGGEAAAPLAAEIMYFFGQNALDSGNDTWEKTLYNNGVGVISKCRK